MAVVSLLLLRGKQLVRVVEIALQMNLFKRFKNVEFWLLAIAASLITLQLHWTWEVGSTDQIGISLFLWGGVLYLLWQKHPDLKLESGVFASASGLALIIVVLARNLSVHVSNDILVEISPFVTAVGLGLIASGFKGLKQYWQELILMAALVMPRVVVATFLEQVINLNVLGATFTHFSLWYLGFDVTRQGPNVILPTGVVEVNSSCSGLDSMLIVLRLAVLFLVLFPTRLIDKILVPVVSVLLAFFINGIRIILMALLVAFSNPETFEYWHQGTGSQIFSLVTMVLFGLFCRYLWQLGESRHSAVKV